MEALFNKIKIYTQLSIEAQNAIENSFEKIFINKNELIFKEGQICDSLCFLESGVIRGFYSLNEKQESSHWFSFDNDFFTSFRSFISIEKSVENIQALTFCVAFKISKIKLNELCNQFHEIEKTLRLIYENYYVRLEERFINSQFKTAKERYEDIQKNAPHIIEKIPLGNIASYLGITQETLSRIRNNI